MRHLRVVVTGLLIAGSAVLAACSGGTAATPSAPEPQTAITARVLGQLLDQHDPGSYAIARHVRMSPTKVRRVIDVVRGLPVTEALDVLRFAPLAASEPAGTTTSARRLPLT